MKRVDAHQHFWTYDHTQYPWINDAMPSLKQDRLPQHLAPLLEKFNFDGCIAIQARQAPDENHFLINLAERNSWILGVIGWLDLYSISIADDINLWQSHRLMKGFRHLIQDEPDPDALLSDDTFNHSIDLILNCGMIYEVLVREKNLPSVIKFCSHHDQSWLILDHMGKPNIANGSFTQWQKQIQRLSNQKHVICKLSGLITEASKGWSPEQIYPYIEIALEYFGADRLLFGSDWPVCCLAGTYQQVYQLIDIAISQLSSDEKNAIWGNNAIKIYNL